MKDTLFLFFVYAFFGWTVEVIYAAVTRGKLENRGFLNGPVCPIYGVGVLAVLWILRPVQDQLLLLFPCSVLLTTALELVSGFLMKKLFRHVWWDYSGEPLNFHGYICLKFSLLWGMACVLVVGVVHPEVNRLLNLLPENLVTVLVSVFLALFVLDGVVTLLCLIQWNRTLAALDSLSRFLHGGSDLLTKGVGGGALKLKAAGKKAKQEVKDIRTSVREKEEMLWKRARCYGGHFLRAFPQFRSLKYTALAEKAREHWNGRKNRSHDKAEQKAGTGDAVIESLTATAMSETVKSGTEAKTAESPAVPAAVEAVTGSADAEAGVETASDTGRDGEETLR